MAGNLRSFLSVLVAVAIFFSFGLEADAQQQQRMRSQRIQPGVAQIPVQIGVGPTGYFLGGPITEPEFGFGGQLMDDKLIHSGLRISVTAVIDREVARRHPNLLPRNYRQQVGQGQEIRIAPSVVALIPTSLFISPPVFGDAQAYGATWSLFGVGLPLSRDPVRISLNGALIGTVMYIRSPSLQNQNYIFARPGAEFRFDVEIPIERDFRLGIGASTQLYVPQTLRGTGADSFGAGEFLDSQSLWNISQIYIQGHFRIPYDYRYQ